jgi:hypothetical protein
MNRQCSSDRLHLNDDRRFHDQVDAVVLLEMNSLVHERYGALNVVSKLAGVQFEQETAQVSGFEETRAEDSMNLDRSREYLSRDRVEFSLHEHAMHLCKPIAATEMA